MNKLPLAIYGAGGLGRELKTWIDFLPQYKFIGFFDDKLPKDSVVDGAPVLGGLSFVAMFCGEELNIVIGIGDPRVKKKIDHQLSGLTNVVFPAVVHPRAVLDDPASVILGSGSVITAGCAMTTSIRVGRHVLVNLNCTVGHDVTIGDYASVMPGAHLSGQVSIGAEALVGTGSCLLNAISVGDRAKIGAGAVVLEDIPADCTAVGVPAKIIQSK